MASVASEKLRKTPFVLLSISLLTTRVFSQGDRHHIPKEIIVMEFPWNLQCASDSLAATGERNWYVGHTQHTPGVPGSGFVRGV